MQSPLCSAPPCYKQKVKRTNSTIQLDPCDFKGHTHTRTNVKSNSIESIDESPSAWLGQTLVMMERRSVRERERQTVKVKLKLKVRE